MPSILNATTTSGLVTSADNSGSLQLQTNNGTTAVTIDTSQNVGIGTTSPAVKCHVSSSAGVAVRIDNPSSTSTGLQSYLNGNLTSAVDFSTAGTIFYQNAGSGACPERMRIDSLGRLLIGKTVSTATTPGILLSSASGQYQANTNNDWNMELFGNGGFRIRFNGSDNGTSTVGSITSGTSSTSYTTTSDYRLKENITPMTGALDKVKQLKPCNYTWKSTGEAGQGFIAHELQAVVPDAVTGEKDAVNEDGSINPQGVDTSFLVATLTAAIQEQQAMIETLQAEVQALKGVA